MTTYTAVKASAWIERARALAPLVEQWRDVGERERHLPRPLFEALRDAGVFRMSVSTVLGGDAVDDETALRAVYQNLPRVRRGGTAFPIVRWEISQVIDGNTGVDRLGTWCNSVCPKDGHDPPFTPLEASRGPSRSDPCLDREELHLYIAI